MNYPRIVRIESAPGNYEKALPFYQEWKFWGLRINACGDVGATLSVCRADGSKGRDGILTTECIEAEDWRARCELTIWDSATHRKIKEAGLPEGGTITLETDQVVAPEGHR